MCRSERSPKDLGEAIEWECEAIGAFISKDMPYAVSHTQVGRMSLFVFTISLALFTSSWFTTSKGFDDSLCPILETCQNGCTADICSTPIKTSSVSPAVDDWYAYGNMSSSARSPTFVTCAKLAYIAQLSTVNFTSPYGQACWPSCVGTGFHVINLADTRSKCDVLAINDQRRYSIQCQRFDRILCPINSIMNMVTTSLASAVVSWYAGKWSIKSFFTLCCKSVGTWIAMATFALAGLWIWASYMILSPGTKDIGVVFGTWGMSIVSGIIADILFVAAAYCMCSKKQSDDYNRV